MIKVLTFILSILVGIDCYANLLDIQTDTGVVSYQVEIANTPTQRAQGLMNRKELPDNQGMLLLFSPPKIVNMWMKNTYIPLDMIFIDKNDIIVHIYEKATPLNTDLISSIYPVSKILEINATQVQKNGIKVGQKISLN